MRFVRWGIEIVVKFFGESFDVVWGMFRGMVLGVYVCEYDEFIFLWFNGSLG